MGCICVNGQHKILCERPRNQAFRAGKQGAALARTCSCCPGSESHVAQTAAASAAPLGCCGQVTEAPVTKEPAFARVADCCRPVWHVPVLSSAAKSAILADLTVQLGWLGPVSPSAVVVATRAAVRTNGTPHPLPPRDLTIALQVFVI